MRQQIDPGIELELITDITCVDIKVMQVDVQPTTVDDWHVRIQGRLGDEEDEDVEFSAFGLIYVLGALSFSDGRPRGYSERDFNERDDWTVGDMLHHLRFEQGELHFYADYVRGRCLKTNVCVRRDGTFTLETVNRGQAATRWIARLQGKKPLTAVTQGAANDEGPVN